MKYKENSNFESIYLQTDMSRDAIVFSLKVDKYGPTKLKKFRLNIYKQHAKLTEKSCPTESMIILHRKVCKTYTISILTQGKADNCGIRERAVM
jgi:hypothetical protein